ncbi:MAG TPA: proline iminopeptidase-family hydrolase [Thermoanaerobaculia bacterium]|nr:proline iminopeptidase-family hydrolase [Thermoanaerobaculia bacterium]
MRKLLIASALVLFAVASIAADVKTGGAKMIEVDGKYHVWTDRVGHGPVKMLTLHGGPGFPHDYFECFEDFLPQHGIQFFYYDQLGVGNSDVPDDVSLWTIPRYRSEVEQVRKGLGLDHFILYGHSWGGMLAIEYALEHQDHLKALIISDMTAGIPAYEKYAATLLAELSPEDQKTLAKFAAAGNYDAPEYQEIMMGKVYAQHLIRLDPWPEPVARAFRKFNQKIYNEMQGPNEFVISGNFKSWDRWADLPKIKVPTLIIAGRHGTMSPDDIRRMGKLIPHSRVVITEGSHLEMYDDQDRYFREVVKFIKDVEAGKMK